jgi:2-polyprenyl-3-methyl-5-hydroxy-6-metoxy-1,4-benzoquinol methylase
MVELTTSRQDFTMRPPADLEIDHTSAPPSTRCIVCAGPLRRWFSRGGRDVFRCPACAHIQVPSGVALVDGVSIYEAGQLFESDGNQEYYLDEGTLAAARDKLRFVDQAVEPDRHVLLDLGASYGHFLSVAAPRFDAYGVEASAAAVEWGRQEFGVRNLVGSLYDLPQGVPPRVDIITAWDVIEHLAEPREALERCHERLTTNGWLFMSTPDAGSLIAGLLGRRWYYQDPLQHINLFSRRNLARVVEAAGFSVRETRYFGRQYKVNYVLNRLRYLTGGAARPVFDTLMRLPESIRSAHVTIKLHDVMGIAAQRR